MKAGFALLALNYEDWAERYETNDFSRPATTPDSVTWERILGLADLAEPLGFDSIWAPEHHTTPYCQTPNPLTVISYMAGRTTSRRLRHDGRGVALAPSVPDRGRARARRQPAAGQESVRRHGARTECTRVRCVRRSTRAKRASATSKRSRSSNSPSRTSNSATTASSTRSRRRNSVRDRAPSSPKTCSVRSAVHRRSRSSPISICRCCSSRARRPIRSRPTLRNSTRYAHRVVCLPMRRVSCSGSTAERTKPRCKRGSTGQSRSDVRQAATTSSSTRRMPSGSRDSRATRTMPEAPRPAAGGCRPSTNRVPRSGRTR